MIEAADRVILNALLDKYETSKRFSGENKVDRKIQVQVTALCKRQSKVQKKWQFKYKEFGNQSTRFSAIKIQRYRQRVCLLEL